MELRSRRLFLQFGLLQSGLSGEGLQLFADLLILSLDVLQIALSGVEIVLVFSTVVAAVVLLNYLGLFVEEFGLFVVALILLALHEFAMAQVATPDPLNLASRALNIVVLPLGFEHLPRLPYIWKP